MIDTNIEPNIYVACLACYNDGKLRGLHHHPKDAVAAAETQLELTGCDKPEHEEYAIHDSEGLGHVSEYASLTSIAERAEYVDAANENGHGDAIQAWINDGYDAEDFGDAYMGERWSFSEFAEELIDDSGDLDALPDYLRPYFDYDSFARDLEHDYIVLQHGNSSSGVFIFSQV
jgi:antirestriction protein